MADGGNSNPNRSTTHEEPFDLSGVGEPCEKCKHLKTNVQFGAQVSDAEEPCEMCQRNIQSER